mgnify:CR=1 FL=1
MRLHEIFTDEEWQRLEQLIYATTWRALATYQQHRATQQRIASKTTSTIKPLVAKKAKALARKAQRPPHAEPPRPLPTPKQPVQAKAKTHSAYRPVKTAKPLPPTTRMAVQPHAGQPAAKPTASNTVMNFGDLDQAARRMLPADKRGHNPIDLISP